MRLAAALLLPLIAAGMLLISKGEEPRTGMADEESARTAEDPSPMLRGTAGDPGSDSKPESAPESESESESEPVGDAIEFEVRDAETGRVIEDAQVRVVLDAEGVRRAFATSPGYRPGRGVPVPAEGERRRLTLELVPTALLVIRIVDADTRDPLAISHDLLPVVLDLSDPEAEAAWPSFGPLHENSRRPGSLIYQLAAGPHVVRLEDETLEVEGRPALRFLPVMAEKEFRVGTVMREETELVVPVTYRSYVRLRVVSGTGRVLDSATLEVHQGGNDGRRILPASWQTGRMHAGWHFDGYLARDTYRVVIRTADGARAEESLIVDAPTLEQDFEAPD